MLVGGQASVVRATIMASIYVMSIVLGRQNAAPVGLVLAAAVMVALDTQVVHDVGFQLSFAATFGLITLGSQATRRLEALVARWPAAARSPVTAPLIETLAITSAAIAFTLPITALAFGEVSVVALPANLFAVPAFVAVAATAALAVAASVLPGGEVMAWVAWVPATYMIGVIELFASLPRASVTVGGVDLWMAVPYYALLGGVYVVADATTDVAADAADLEADRPTTGERAGGGGGGDRRRRAGVGGDRHGGR